MPWTEQINGKEGAIYMKKIMLAIGDKSVEEWLEKKLVDCTFTQSCGYRQRVIPAINNEVPDVLIISEFLAGRDGEKGVAILDLLQEIRINFPKVRIIFVGNEHDYENPDDTFLDKITKMGIYDIICPNPRKGEILLIADVAKLVNKPADYAYASKFMHQDQVSQEEKKAEENKKEVMIMDEVPKKRKRTESIENEESSQEKSLSKNEIAKRNSARLEKAKDPNVIKSNTKETSVKTTIAKIETANETTVLVARANSGLIFRPAIKEDFTTVFNRESLPNPEGYEGNHKRKEILYGNSQNMMKKARITVFAGARQGVGTTTTALNVATGIAQSFKRKTLYIDCSFENAVFDHLGISDMGWSSIADLNPRSNFVEMGVRKKDLEYASVNKERLSVLPEQLSYINLGRQITPTTIIPQLNQILFGFSCCYENIIIDLDIKEKSEVGKIILAMADDVVCVTTVDVYEINCLLAAISRYRTEINLTGKYSVLLNKYIKSPLDLEYLAETLCANNVLCIKNNFKEYIEASSKWLPTYLVTKKRAIRKEYEGVIGKVIIHG